MEGLNVREKANKLSKLPFRMNAINCCKTKYDFPVGLKVCFLASLQIILIPSSKGTYEIV